MLYSVVYLLFPACWWWMGGGDCPFLLFYGVSPPASPASHLAGLLRRKDLSRNPGPTAWCVSVATEEMLCSMFVNEITSSSSS